MQWIPFDQGWTCRRLDGSNEALPVLLPHDAMLEEKRTQSAEFGSSNGWFEVYDYLYEKHFVPDEAWKDKKLLLAFDGISGEATVTLNGETIAEQPLSLHGFEADLTGKLCIGCENVLAVSVASQANMGIQWYTGAGICRRVRLWYGNEKHISFKGVRVRTLSVDQPEIAVQVNTSCPGQIRVSVYDGSRMIANAEAETTEHTVLSIPIPGGELWHPEHPKLYTCRVSFEDETVEKRFGLQTLTWSQQGLFLNEERLILAGACLVQNDGLLGAKSYPEAELRRVSILKECGYNAILTVGAPCSEALLDACDALGMMVIDEYAAHWFNPGDSREVWRDFAEKAIAGLQHMAEKDQDHPCLAAYSIGNGVPESVYERGVELAELMTGVLHRADNCHPVVLGLNPWTNGRVILWRKDKDLEPKPGQPANVINKIFDRLDASLLPLHDDKILSKSGNWKGWGAAYEAWEQVDIAGCRYA